MSQALLDSIAKEIGINRANGERIASDFDALIKEMKDGLIVPASKSKAPKTDATVDFGDGFSQEDSETGEYWQKNYMETEGNEGTYQYAMNKFYHAPTTNSPIVVDGKTQGYHLGNRSKRELVGVHPDLVHFVHELIKRSPVDFGVLDGVRTMREQEKLVARGVSKTYNSYHIWGLAVDIVPYIKGRYTWDNKEAFEMINQAAKEVIAENGYSIDNGADMWNWDEPHWQMTGMKSAYDIRAGGFLEETFTA